MNTKYFIGIDLHKNNAFWTIKNSRGDVLKRINFDVEETKTRSLARKIRILGITKAVLEPVCAWRKYHNWLEGEGIPTKVVNPLQVKAIAYNRLKNDRVDSEILADLLRLNFLPEIKPQDTAAVELSYLVKLRQFLVEKRTKLKQKTREILIKENQDIKRCDVFGKKAQKELKNLNLPSADKKIIEFILNVAGPLNNEIKNINKHLEERYGNLENIQILRSIPGIGLIASLSIESIVGDWSRFKRPGDLASYAGLVPSSKDSGGKTRRGRITKRGSRLLRAMVYRAAVTGSRYAPFNSFYERIKSKKGGKLARVALARKLLTIAWHLIKKQEKFKKTRPLDHLEKFRGLKSHSSASGFLKEGICNTNKPDLVFRLAPLGDCTID